MTAVKATRPLDPNALSASPEEAARFLSIHRRTVDAPHRGPHPESPQGRAPGARRYGLDPRLLRIAASDRGRAIKTSKQSPPQNRDVKTPALPHRGAGWIVVDKLVVSPIRFTAKSSDPRNQPELRARRPSSSPANRARVRSSCARRCRWRSTIIRPTGPSKPATSSPPRSKAFRRRRIFPRLRKRKRFSLRSRN